MSEENEASKSSLYLCAHHERPCDARELVCLRRVPVAFDGGAALRAGAQCGIELGRALLEQILLDRARLGKRGERCKESSQ